MYVYRLTLYFYFCHFTPCIKAGEVNGLERKLLKLQMLSMYVNTIGHKYVKLTLRNMLTI